MQLKRHCRGFFWYRLAPVIFFCKRFKAKLAVKIGGCTAFPQKIDIQATRLSIGRIHKPCQWGFKAHQHIIRFNFTAFATRGFYLYRTLSFGHDGGYFKATIFFKKYVHACLSIF